MMKSLLMERVPVTHGWVWIHHGFRLIMRSPLHAVSLAMVFAVGIMLAMMVPVGGIFLAVVVTPVLMAGYMRVCRTLEFNELVEPRLIFSGFTRQTARLFNLGAMLLLGMVMISMFIAILGGDELGAILQKFQTDLDPAKLAEALLAPESGLRFILLLGFALFFVLMMAIQFAPMLVYFNQLSPLDALRISLKATLRNFIPFSLYSLIMQFFTLLLGMIPFDLGLIFLMPLMLTSMYVAYRDIFSEVVDEPDSAAEPPVNPE